QHSCTAQIEKALGDGATEIDYVMPYRQLLNGKITEVELALNSIRACVPASIHLKVILETGELKTAQNIKMASELAIDCGADFIKTSTGKVVTNATPETAAIMLDVIAKKNRDIGFKPAGGIRTVNDAEKYLQLAEDKLGEAWLNAAHFRIGASGLLQDALNLVEPT
ncbi:MAG: deoxyribose-phosphate aldolase, partial [Gammaproteobacteria bacterium]